MSSYPCKNPITASDFCGFKEIDGNNVPRFALVKEINIDLQQFLNEIIKENDFPLHCMALCNRNRDCRMFILFI